MIDDMHADPTADLEDLLRVATVAPGRRALDELEGWWHRSPELADRVTAAWLRAEVAGAASGGWRPVDVARALTAIAPRAQADLVDRLDAGLAAWRTRHQLTPGLAVAHVVGTAQAVRRLGRIPFVTDDTDAGDVDPGVLAKVRALLAKAESTTFEAEAEALTAKAHQLMVRHTIDEALVAGRSGGGEVTARRVFVDDPYRRAKYLLLSEVARASSCRALLSTTYGFATVFGHRSDLDAVELLYTSLLLQATAGVVHARPRGRVPAARVAAYRRSWLLAFASRIGERLEAAAASTAREAEAELGREVLPVLASRADAVERAVKEAAPRTTTMRVSSSSPEGAAAGFAAGDRASLDRSARLGGRRGVLGRG